jgi:diguanylate cyclase (GGDEF)-like protein/PAS domain S-box-containing protein
LAAAAALLCGAVSQAFVTLAPGTGLWWPALGLALGLMLRWPGHVGPMAIGLVAGGVLSPWSQGLPWWSALGLSIAQVAIAWLMARCLQRLDFKPTVRGGRDLGLVAGAAVAGAVLHATLVATGWSFSPHTQGTAWSATWWAAFASTALGVLLLTPPLLLSRRAPLLAALQGTHRAATLALISALAASGLALVLLPHSPLVQAQVMLVPVVVVTWLSLRQGAAVAVLTLLIWATAISLVTHGFGPMWIEPLGALTPTVLCAQLLTLCLLAALPLLVQGDLVESAQRWQAALDSSDIGVADWDLQTGQHHASARWRALLADADGALSAKLSSVIDLLHPDDRAAIDAVVAASPTRTVNTVRQDVRLKVHDLWCWFDMNLKVRERDAQGAPLRVLATLLDIEAQRGAHERQQLSSNLFMHLHEGLLITDDQMRVLDANPTYSRITGVPREELLGTVPSLLNPGSEADPLSQQQSAAMWAELHTGGQWTGEVIERRRTGDPCALHVTVSSVNGPDGGLRYHVLVVSDITEQRLQSERIERQANFDELTRLPNRAHLSQLLLDAMHLAESDGHLLAVCYLDLDHFKTVNERLGHQAGDRLLAELAIRLRGALRSRGTARADIAARLGGDEFALLLHAGSVEEARFAVERVLRLVAQPFMVAPNGTLTEVTASVGVTVYPLDGSDADTLLRHADHAMYGAKQAGRNGHLFFDTEHRRRTEERVLAIGRVQEALDQNELTLYYQPKVDLRRGTVLGVEALLRWNHPERGVVSPVHFLPLIEHTGLSARIGDHVLARALNQLEAWHEQGLDLSVSVNITARHMQEPDFVQRLTELLARHAQPLGPKLELEVLETAALADVGFTSSLLSQCARLGVRWALDDFGTGYSTLTYLKRLPVQVLKVDRSFVQNMLTDTQDRAIVEGLIGLARSFDCTAVAEGVETAAQARMLLDMGCDIGQGEGIASPMPADQVADWVRNWRGLFALGQAPRVANGVRDTPPDATP